MTQPITFYSHRRGPNPWKNVTIFEELGLPYETTYLDFGDSKGGVEHADFLKKNPAGRVPLIWDPATNTALTESNVINQYLVEHYDKDGLLKVNDPGDQYLVNQWLGFQASAQAPFFAQTMIFLGKNNPEAVAHFQGLVKRTLGTVNQALEGKQYLVADRLTLADLAFIPWDLTLEIILERDAEAGTEEKRKAKFPNWYAWHQRLLSRPAVRKMMEIQGAANA